MHLCRIRVVVRSSTRRLPLPPAPPPRQLGLSQMGAKIPGTNLSSKPSGGAGSNVTASVKKSSDPRKVASKNESKCSSTVRVRDKQGYTEYHKSERVTRVDYGSKKLGSANK